MTIDPRIGMWLSIFAAAVSALVAAGAEFTNVFGPDNAKIILGILGLFNVVLNSVNAVLHAIPGMPGPKGAKQYPLG